MDQKSISAEQVYYGFTQKSNHSNNLIFILQVILVGILENISEACYGLLRKTQFC